MRIWFYYNAKLERHFAIVLYTNLAVSHVSENQELVRTDKLDKRSVNFCPAES